MTQHALTVQLKLLYIVFKDVLPNSFNDYKQNLLIIQMIRLSKKKHGFVMNLNSMWYLLKINNIDQY